MSRYIDADKRKAELIKLFGCDTYAEGRFNTSMYVSRMFDDAPTADVAPVVHARWIQHNAGPLKSECSACRTTFNARMEYDGLTTKHCPCCAAIMDADAWSGWGRDKTARWTRFKQLSTASA